jgi:hypothetical protein
VWKQVLEWIPIIAVWTIPIILWRMKKHGDRRKLEAYKKEARGMIESAQEQARVFRSRQPHSADNGNDAKD